QAMFHRLAKGTARRPENWDSFEMGAGVVDALALLEADLKLNRGLESVPQEDSADVRSQISIESLVLATLGEKALPSQFDWNKYGAEVATAILRAKLLEPSADGLETASFEGIQLSPDLMAAPGAAPLIARMKGIS